MFDRSFPVIEASRANALPATSAAGVQRRSSASVYTEFEAALLTVLVEAALPKGKAAFGAGLAGQMARSELAQHLGGAIAAHGTMGLASSLERASRR